MGWFVRRITSKAGMTSSDLENLRCPFDRRGACSAGPRLPGVPRGRPRGQARDLSDHNRTSAALRSFVRLSDVHLLKVFLELLLQRSPPRLFTAAAWSGLGPAPESRSRGALPHLSRSFTASSTSFLTASAAHLPTCPQRQQPQQPFAIVG
jgi:hypothetical protein